MPVLTTPSSSGERNTAAITALPHPPSTSHSVPSTSAIALRCRSIRPSIVRSSAVPYVVPVVPVLLRGDHGGRRLRDPAAAGR